jgi:hypothetical protein
MQEPLLGQRHGHDMGRGIMIEVRQPGIARKRSQILLDLARGRLLHRQRQPRIALQQRRAKPPDKRQGRGNRRQPERPGKRRTGGRHGLGHAAHGPQDLLGPGQHRLALFGQPDKAPVALDQPLAQFLFERHQPRRKRGLRNPAFRRRTGKMTVARKGDEIPQMAQLHGPAQTPPELRDRLYHGRAGIPSPPLLRARGNRSHHGSNRFIPVRSTRPRRLSSDY